MHIFEKKNVLMSVYSCLKLLELLEVTSSTEHLATLLTSDHTLDFQNPERMNFCCFKYSNLGYFVTTPRENECPLQVQKAFR